MIFFFEGKVQNIYEVCRRRVAQKTKGIERIIYEYVRNDKKNSIYRLYNYNFFALQYSIAIDLYLIVHIN